MKHLKATLFAISKSDTEAPIKKALAGRGLFLPLSPTPISLSTTFYIKMPALAQGTHILGRDLVIFPGEVSPDGSTMALLHCGD